MMGHAWLRLVYVLVAVSTSNLESVVQLGVVNMVKVEPDSTGLPVSLPAGHVTGAI